MSLLNHLHRLYDYTYWAHDKLWHECILKLTDEQFTRPLDYSLGSIHHQSVHVITAEWIWYSRLSGTSPAGRLDPADYPTRDTVYAKRQSMQALMHEYLAGLTEADLDAPVMYHTTGNKQYTQTTADILYHVVNHGTDHRAQILAMLHTMGAPTIEQDFIFYLRSKQDQA